MRDRTIRSVLPNYVGLYGRVARKIPVTNQPTEGGLTRCHQLNQLDDEDAGSQSRHRFAASSEAPVRGVFGSHVQEITWGPFPEDK